MNDLCQHCDKRKATENWVGTGGLFDFIHGNYSRWCKRCVLKESIKNIRKQITRLPGLEKQLQKLDK